MMYFLSLLLVGNLVFCFGGFAPETIQDNPLSAQQAAGAQRYGLDPTSSLEARVQKTPEAVLKMFAEPGEAAPTPHPLTHEERSALSAALAVLPPLHQQVLRARLRSISFLDRMPNTALTSTVNPNEPFRLFDLTIRAGVLHQNVSEWLTQKERTCFNAAGSPLRVSIEAGKRPALVFVLLHEATHMVAASLGLTPTSFSDEPSAPGALSSPFTQGVWTDSTTPAPLYRDPLRERLRFRTGEILPIDQAEAIYQSLRRTPFVSLYGSLSWHEDLAEYVAVYHWTQKLKQPYRIVMRNTGKQIFVYEPMHANLVRGRIPQMKRFYERQPGCGG